MEENDEIKKDREALNEYLKKDNISDFKKFAEEFAKKAGIEHQKVFAKVVDDESNFKINYYDSIKNPFGVKSTPARIKSNGIIEVSKEHFLKKSIGYHEWNYRSRILVIHEINAMDMEMIQNVDITNKKIREWFDYADISLRRLKESEDVLIKEGVIKKRDYITLGLIKFFKANLVELYCKRLDVLN